MTISEPNPDVEPTGEAAGEFLDPPEPPRTHADERDVGEDEPADWPPLADGSTDDRDEVMDGV